MKTILQNTEAKMTIESSNVSESAKQRIIEEMEYYYRFEIKKLVEETVFDLQDYDRLVVAIHSEFGLLDTNTCVIVKDLIMSLVEAHSTIDMIIGMLLFRIDILKSEGKINYDLDLEEIL